MFAGQRRRLIKEVRGNLLLGWIREAFPEIPIVLVLRHPCAVVHSQLKLDATWNWHTEMSSLLGQQALVEDHLGAFREELAAAAAGSPFERHLYMWCVENLVPLRQLAPGAALVSFYEDLVASPEAELRRLFSFISKPFDPRVLTGLRRPSAVTRRDSPIASGRSATSAWRDELEPDQVRRAMAILGRFGLDRIYGESPDPLVDGAEVLGLLT